MTLRLPRRFQFSLRAMLLAMAVVGVASLSFRWWHAGHTPIKWQSFSRTSLVDAVAEGRPVIVNFTLRRGCYFGWIHETAFDDPAVRRMINNGDFLALEADLINLPDNADLDAVGYNGPGIAVYSSRSIVPHYVESMSGEVANEIRTELSPRRSLQR